MNPALFTLVGLIAFAVIFLILAGILRHSSRQVDSAVDPKTTFSVHDRVMSLHGSDLDPRLQDALAEYALRMDKELVAKQCS